jgi:CBS domain-containing protein
MLIKDIMTADVATCSPDTDLASIVKLMWDRDCGFIPVVDGTGHVAGVLTDRDICIAAATRGVAPHRISAGQAMHPTPVRAASPDDSIDAALAAMRDSQVHRLPVLTDDGRLVGVVSMNDLVLRSGEPGGPAPRDVVASLAAICSHRDVLATA